MRSLLVRVARLFVVIFVVSSFFRGDTVQAQEAVGCLFDPPECVSGNAYCDPETHGWICPDNCLDSAEFDIREGLPSDILNRLNPLSVGTGACQPDPELNQPAGLINRSLRYLFPFAGLVLFVMTVWGGFEVLSTAASKKSIDAGKQRIQAAIIGFIMLFTAYWLMMIVEAVFSIKILSQ